MIEKIPIELNEMQSDDWIKELEEPCFYYTHSLPLFSIGTRIVFFFYIAIALLYAGYKRLLFNELINIFIAPFVKVLK